MNPEVVVAVVSAVLSLLSAVIASLMTAWSAKRSRRYDALIDERKRALTKAEQAEAVLSRYREPLLGAAHNLQARLYNIVNIGFLDRYLHDGDPEQQAYARSTRYTSSPNTCAGRRSSAAI